MKTPMIISHKARAVMHFAWKRTKLRMSDSSGVRKSRFCGLTNVRTLSVIIAIAEILFLICQGLVAVSYLSAPTSSHVLAASVQALAVATASVAIMLLLIGVFCRIPALIVPHMLMQVLFVLILLGMACIALYTLLVGTSVHLRIVVLGSQIQSSTNIMSALNPIKLLVVSRFLTGLIVLVAACYVTGALLNVWCFHVVVDCYRSISYQIDEKNHVLTEGNGRRAAEKPVPVIHATDF